MKRLIIEGDVERHGPKPDGDRWVVMDGEGIHAAWIRDDCPRVRITVEDVPDPLPTEPGVRFWGRSTHFGPQWWFVCESTSCRPEDGEVDYVAAGGYRLSSYVAESTHGLVRLPDPEATP